MFWPAIATKTENDKTRLVMRHSLPQYRKKQDRRMSIYHKEQ